MIRTAYGPAALELRKATAKGANDALRMGELVAARPQAMSPSSVRFVRIGKTQSNLVDSWRVLP